MREEELENELNTVLIEENEQEAITTTNEEQTTNSTNKYDSEIILLILKTFYNSVNNYIEKIESAEPNNFGELYVATHV